MHEEGGLLVQAFVYLVAGVVSVPIAKRLGLGSVLGYLIAGVIIGPYALALVQDAESVMKFAEFGVVIMLFLIGLELKPSLLWQMRGPILGLGGMQVGITGAVLTAIGLALGYPWQTSLAVGMILALSSTAIVLQTFNEKGLLKTGTGQAGFSVLLFQDIAVIPMLALLPLLALAPDSAANASHEAVRPGWQQALMVVGAVGAIIFGGRFLARPLFRFIASSNLREIFTAAALLIVIGIDIAMVSVGVSAALGSFLGGVVLADSEYRHELESNIEPFKGLLLGLFFISVGAAINFEIFLNSPWTILLLAAALMLIKFVILFGLGKSFAMPLRQRGMFAVSLAQGGEFAFVLFAAARPYGVIPIEVADVLILAVAVSMFATPLAIISYEAFARRALAEPAGEREDEAFADIDNPVIIAGFGRFGQIVGRLLMANRVGVTVLDRDASHIDRVREFGYKVYFGDASRTELLHTAGAGDAKLLVLAIDDFEKMLHIAEEARRHFPNLRILARAHDRRHTYRLMEKGVGVIRRETFDSALSLGVDALTELGFEPERAAHAAELFKSHDEQTLGDLFESWQQDEKTFILKSRQRRQDLEQLLGTDAAETDNICEEDAVETAEPV